MADLNPKAEAARQYELDLNWQCQEALEPLLRNSGYHVRIVFYPGPGARNFRQPFYKWLWRILFLRLNKSKQEK